MFSPTCSGVDISKSTPLAETFRVSAPNSAVPVESTTGSASGKRTAHRTSCPAACDWECRGRTIRPDFATLFINRSRVHTGSHGNCSGVWSQSPRHESFLLSNYSSSLLRSAVGKGESAAGPPWFLCKTAAQNECSARESTASPRKPAAAATGEACNSESMSGCNVQCGGVCSVHLFYRRSSSLVTGTILYFSSSCVRIGQGHDRFGVSRDCFPILKI